MNCPSRTDEPEGTGFNQNPSALAADLTTRQDFNGIANSRILRRMQDSEIENKVLDDPDGALPKGEKGKEMAVEMKGDRHVATMPGFDGVRESYDIGGGSHGTGAVSLSAKCFMRLRKVVVTFGKFVGPGFMVGTLFITVRYI